MTDNYAIVPAKRRHLAAVPAIEQAAAGLFSERDLPLGLRFLVTRPETLVEALEHGRIWVALAAGGAPVGFAYAVEVAGEAHLDETSVHPGHARRGIGTRLVRTVINWSRTRGYRGLTLVTFRHLPWNAPFYAKLGFRALTGDRVAPELLHLIEQEGDAGINTEDRIIMRLKLQ